jgi:hypothetical protein
MLAFSTRNAPWLSVPVMIGFAMIGCGDDGGTGGAGGTSSANGGAGGDGFDVAAYCAAGNACFGGEAICTQTMGCAASVFSPTALETYATCNQAAQCPAGDECITAVNDAVEPPASFAAFQEACQAKFSDCPDAFSTNECVFEAFQDGYYAAGAACFDAGIACSTVSGCLLDARGPEC